MRSLRIRRLPAGLRAIAVTISTGGALATDTASTVPATLRASGPGGL
ncbi:hypothetical protein [Streptosporangium sp. KLBMP 9127]|nr:hypothetical protein [Streptosporangium sp. KLBMP 9127]